MKKIFFGIVVAVSLLFVSCDNNEEALNFYHKAKEAYENGDFLKVKELSDSIKAADNTAFDEIRAGLQLSRKAELAINEQTLLYADSMLRVLQTETNNLLNDFELAKDEEYQTAGELRYKHDPNRATQTKSCLRVYVTEDGELILMSIHSGSTSIKHESFKLSLSDGTYIMSDVIPYDEANNYRYSTNGMYVETITYKEPKTTSIAQFVVDSKGAPITITYDGKKPYKYTMEKSTRKAIIECYRLSELIKQTKKYQRDQAIASQTMVILKTQIEDHKGDSI